MAKRLKPKKVTKAKLKRKHQKEALDEEDFARLQKTIPKGVQVERLPCGGIEISVLLPEEGQCTTLYKKSK